MKVISLLVAWRQRFLPIPLLIVVQTPEAFAVFRCDCVVDDVLLLFQQLLLSQLNHLVLVLAQHILDLSFTVDTDHIFVVLSARVFWHEVFGDVVVLLHFSWIQFQNKKFFLILLNFPLAVLHNLPMQIPALEVVQVLRSADVRQELVLLVIATCFIGVVTRHAKFVVANPTETPISHAHWKTWHFLRPAVLPCVVVAWNVIRLAL